MTRRVIIAAAALVALIAIAVNACDDKLSRQLEWLKPTWEEISK